MIAKPVIGMRCRLNNLGLQNIHLRTVSGIQGSQDMRILWVGSESLTSDVDTFPINVDCAEVNRYMLDNHMVDAI